MKHEQSYEDETYVNVCIMCLVQVIIYKHAVSNRKPMMLLLSYFDFNLPFLIHIHVKLCLLLVTIDVSSSRQNSP